MIYKENNKEIAKRDNKERRYKDRKKISGNFIEKIKKSAKEYSILTMSLLLIVAGYVSYLSKYERTKQVSGDANKVADIGDATLVNSNDISENDVSVEEDEQAKKENKGNKVAVDNKMDDKKEEAEGKDNEKKDIQTNAKPETDEYFISSRLERENMHSQTIETYQKILENNNCSVEQKTEASKKINEINERKNSIMIAENLIKTKGFEDCVVFVNTESVSIIVKKEELSQEDIAKIQNIAVRELSEKVENIHISNKY